MIPQNCKKTFYVGFLVQGLLSPLRQLCISPPVSDFPLCFPKKFLRLRRKFSQFHLFQNCFLIFFSRRLHICNFPLFSLFLPYFGKIFISPYFYKFPSDFIKFACFLTYFL